MNMKIFATLLLCLSLLRSSTGTAVTFGLLICEHGPVVYRYTTRSGENFGTIPSIHSQCKAGVSVCNQQFGYFKSHRGLGMCSVSRDCGDHQQVCLRKFTGASSHIIVSCKVGFEGLVLSGRQEISGDQNPRPQTGFVPRAAAHDGVNVSDAN